MGYANVEWNLTQVRLDAAGFPRDQLLDYLPDNSIDWRYREDEWNSSWSFDCQRTLQTPITLHDTGNCSGFRYEMPNLDEAFGYKQWDGYWHHWDGFYSQPDLQKDILLFIYGWKGWDYEEAADTSRAMRISLVAMHMHHLPRNNDDNSTCNFAKGDVQRASYTKIDCELRRKQHVDDPFNVAFPDVNTNGAVPSAYTEFYQARFTQESTSDSPITVLEPGELIRFYQVYTVVKDLQYRQPVTRPISVSLRVVQLSNAFLAVVVLTAFLILLGLLNYALFALRHHNIILSTPQSKLDWMMQSIQTEDQPLADTKGRLRRSVTVDSNTTLSTLPSTRRKRMEFEKARYGNRQTTTWFLRDSQVGNAYEPEPGPGTYHEGGGRQMCEPPPPPAPAPAPQQYQYQYQGEASNLKTPMLNVGAAVPDDDFYPRPH